MDVFCNICVIMYLFLINRMFFIFIFTITISFILTLMSYPYCSRDCPIFYRRKKAQKDLTEAEVQLERWQF